MTTSSISLRYPSATDRLVARLGRALVRWADERAIATHERQSVVVANQRARHDRERAAAASQYLRG